MTQEKLSAICIVLLIATSPFFFWLILYFANPRSQDAVSYTHLDVYKRQGGNSLLLPNRNLDHGYAKLDLGASYNLFSWLGIYGRAENLTDNQHIAPIGYPSLPFTVRIGARIAWGIGAGKQ